MEDNGILDEAHGAFRRDRRTEDNIFTLQGICALKQSKRVRHSSHGLEIMVISD
jgi:hypothetical protein